MNPLNTELLPRYSRVKRMITDRIDSGEWQPRHRIPSESELVRDLGVSRMTINRALRELTLDGRLIRVQGVGTFVATPKPISPCSRCATSPTRSPRAVIATVRRC